MTFSILYVRMLVTLPKMANKYKSDTKKEVSDEPRSVRQCTHPQRLRRQESAKRCAEERVKRSDAEQLQHLDALLGKNKGAKKERVRLRRKIAEGQKSKTKNKPKLKKSGR